MLTTAESNYISLMNAYLRKERSPGFDWLRSELQGTFNMIEVSIEMVPENQRLTWCIHFRE
jgi:hypothetical protein